VVAIEPSPPHLTSCGRLEQQNLLANYLSVVVHERVREKRFMGDGSLALVCIDLMQLAQHLDCMRTLRFACACAGSRNCAEASPRPVGGKGQVRGAGKPPGGQEKHRRIRPQPARKGDLLAADLFAHDGRSGNGAIHRVQEYVVSDLEFLADEDVFNPYPEGCVLGKTIAYTRWAAASSSPQYRHGSSVSPTAGSLYLVDKGRTWWISSQGQAMPPDAQGADYVPQFDDRQFVKTRMTTAAPASRSRSTPRHTA
jgi:hypothetical protein